MLNLIHNQRLRLALGLLELTFRVASLYVEAEEPPFLHIRLGYLSFYPGIENLIFSRLSHEGYIHWLYWNSRSWSSGDVIIMSK